ncbi:NfeD family protein [Neorhodopirellula pilleata]|uniref:NfeD-like C-terminal domain-containing protein n=1 Tax=Neorhodopirellula pilleata TaxID=2714738 RepID=A0A5C6A7Q8_9BACT|nr:NfeD family protein [Neorhodopirellula pilleata]TWT95476.1 hypothetical protein Pla100_31170 [Neorhodopirellula pilleata]
MPAFYAVVLLFAFYALVFAEILIPSAGLLGISAAVVAITSLIIALTHSTGFALSLFGVYVVTTPIVLTVVLKLWPKTRIGREMLNRDALEIPTAGPPPSTLDGVRLEELTGVCGVVTTPLMPHGQIKINGHKANAVSTGLAIEKGTTVWTLRVQGNDLVVRAATTEEMRMARPSETPGPTGPPHEDTLVKPIDVEPGDSETIRSSLEDIDLETFDEFEKPNP